MTKTSFLENINEVPNKTIKKPDETPRSGVTLRGRMRYGRMSRFQTNLSITDFGKKQLDPFTCLKMVEFRSKSKNLTVVFNGIFGYFLEHF